MGYVFDSCSDRERQRSFFKKKYISPPLLFDFEGRGKVGKNSELTYIFPFFISVFFFFFF